MRALLLPLLGLGAALTLVPADGADPTARARSALQAELSPLDGALLPEPAEAPWPTAFGAEAGPALSGYRDRLVKVSGGFATPVWHQAGTLSVRLGSGRTERLGVNVLLPPGPSQGTLLFVHGYLSHAANFAYTGAWFTARGWTVTTLDLPGHGLSTGPRGDVARFADYGDAVEAWLRWVEAQAWPGPRVLLAHSLGAAASLEALRRASCPRPDRVVFCAPLLRPVNYDVLDWSDAVAGWALTRVPLRFGWDHYLDGDTMPVHWFQALKAWLGQITRQAPFDLPLTVYAGDRDAVVDTGWNRGQLKRLVPGLTDVRLPGWGHLFLTEGATRQAFHERLTRDLGFWD